MCICAGMRVWMYACVYIYIYIYIHIYIYIWWAARHPKATLPVPNVWFAVGIQRFCNSYQQNHWNINMFQSCRPTWRVVGRADVIETLLEMNEQSMKLYEILTKSVWNLYEIQVASDTRAYVSSSYRCETLIFQHDFVGTWNLYEIYTKPLWNFIKSPQCWYGIFINSAWTLYEMFSYDISMESVRNLYEIHMKSL